MIQFIPKRISAYCFLIFCLIASVLFQSCSTSDQKPLFELLDENQTNIIFNNKITVTDSFSVLRFEYIYNGAGVGIGDFNNDGLQDVFFAGNMVSSKLFLNKGEFKFQDVTQQAQLTTTLWCTGVAVADINQDGLVDIHVSTINPDKSKSSPNLVFLNKGIDKEGVPTFEEAGSTLGLADQSYSTQAAFLDYDLDGDLDMYLVTNALEVFNRNTPYGQKKDGTGKSIDKLFRNDGNDHKGTPQFTNVSDQANIKMEGWGLGIVVNDFNNDGYPDIYVSNDFLSNDHLYINQKDGTFINKIADYLKHQEHNGMGIDVADINNDGLNDIICVDMMPNDNLRQKTMFSNIGYDRFFLNRHRGYQDQYVRNVLQLNNGNETFSDIGYLTGVYCTDWSWSALLADFDNNGYRDLLITNGYPKDVTDLDFTSYSEQSSMFGTDDIRLKRAVEATKTLTGVIKTNYLFANKGNLVFENKSKEWGFVQPSYSNGAAYADFDNDGDLDLVMNNIDDNAFVYRNTLREIKTNKNNNYLRIKLNGKKGNTQGLGSKIWVYTKGQFQYAEQELQRGYKSTVEPHLHFGLGDANAVDSLVVLWSDGFKQVIPNVDVNKTMALDQNKAIQKHNSIRKTEQPYFRESHLPYNIKFKQEEIDFVDYKSGQALLPHKHSQSGPGITVGDTNNDGLEDFIIGGSSEKSAVVFTQQKNGSFQSSSFPAKRMEDLGLLLFDADKDGDLDLYCVSGSSEFGKSLEAYQDRLFKNDGKGKFTYDSLALPKIEASGSCVVANDFDKDGDLDLFVGGRVVPLRYPTSPASYLLQNNGQGTFKDVTNEMCSSLKQAGMITSALWTDFDNDGMVDLMLAGEWMAIKMFKNKQGRKFEELSVDGISNQIGWWNSLTGGDIDNDGDIDYVAGNLGRNSIFQATSKEPVSIFASDFDENGSLDPVMTRYIEGKEYPTHYRENMTDQMSFLRRSLTRYAIYGEQKIDNFLPPKKLNEALIIRATNFNSSYIENQGNGRFSIKPLPIESQTAPLFGLALEDVNQDGNLDVIGAGNSYSSETASGLYDAGVGIVLMGDGKGTFNSLSNTISGFFVNSDAKALVNLITKDQTKLWIVSSNQDSLKVFAQKGETNSDLIKLSDNDAHAFIKFKNGKMQKQEFYFGSGYLSGSSRILIKQNNVAEITIVKTNGNQRKY